MVEGLVLVQRGLWQMGQPDSGLTQVAAWRWHGLWATISCNQATLLFIFHTSTVVLRGPSQTVGWARYRCGAFSIGLPSPPNHDLLTKDNSGANACQFECNSDTQIRPAFV